MLAATQAGEVFAALFVQMQFISETVYIWTGIGSITWNGHTWSGVGSFLGIEDAIEDGSNVLARGVTLRLSGIDSTLLSEFEADYQLFNPVTIYFAILSGGSPISSPVNAWTGRMGQPTFTIGAETSIITIACETRMVDMDVAVDRRRTNDDQTQLVPGDLAFNFVAGLQEKTIYFGQTPTSTTNI